MTKSELKNFCAGVCSVWLLFYRQISDLLQKGEKMTFNRASSGSKVVTLFATTKINPFRAVTSESNVYRVIVLHFTQNATPIVYLQVA
jgi:hypothetical protein